MKLLIPILIGLLVVGCGTAPKDVEYQDGILLAADNSKEIKLFFEHYCLDCKDDDSTKGELNLLDTAFDPSGSENFVVWNRVHKHLSRDEMPPKKKKRLGTETQSAMLSWLEDELVLAENGIAQFQLIVEHRGGPVVQKKRNNYQQEGKYSWF